MKLRERIKTWVNRPIVDDDPFDDEAHSRTRYLLADSIAHCEAKLCRYCRAANCPRRKDDMLS